jgi:YceI-like protein
MARLLGLAALILAVTLASAQSRPVDVSASRVTVYAYRSGIFGGFGDNHEIAAPIAGGSLDESARQITLRFDARQMRVLDPKLSADKRSEVQQRMLGPEVLDVAHFSEITFESTSIAQQGNGTFAVSGTLHLHGTAHPVAGTATRTADGYRGSFKVKQHDFGIKPVSIAGGTVKVKDELSIEFDIRPAAAR